MKITIFCKCFCLFLVVVLLGSWTAAEAQSTACPKAEGVTAVTDGAMVPQSEVSAVSSARVKSLVVAMPCQTKEFEMSTLSDLNSAVVISELVDVGNLKRNDFVVFPQTKIQIRFLTSTAGIFGLEILQGSTTVERFRFPAFRPDPTKSYQLKISHERLPMGLQVQFRLDQYGRLFLP